MIDIEFSTAGLDDMINIFRCSEPFFFRVGAYDNIISHNAMPCNIRAISV